MGFTLKSHRTARIENHPMATSVIPHELTTPDGRTP